MSHIQIPHFDLPFHFDEEGHPHAVEQDTTQDVAVCVEAVVRTTQGQRQELPDFGIEDPLFKQNGLNTSNLRTSVEKWEPRVEAAIEEGWDFDNAIQSIRITVRENLSDE